jgi:hypothetical protein
MRLLTTDLLACRDLPPIAVDLGGSGNELEDAQAAVVFGVVCNQPKRVLALPDLEQAKSAVPNTLTSVSRRASGFVLAGRFGNRPETIWQACQISLQRRVFGVAVVQAVE